MLNNTFASTNFIFSDKEVASRRTYVKCTKYTRNTEQIKHSQNQIELNGKPIIKIGLAKMKVKKLTNKNYAETIKQFSADDAILMRDHMDT